MTNPRARSPCAKLPSCNLAGRAWHERLCTLSQDIHRVATIAAAVGSGSRSQIL